MSSGLKQGMQALTLLCVIKLEELTRRNTPDPIGATTRLPYSEIRYGDISTLTTPEKFHAPEFHSDFSKFPNDIVGH